MKKYIAGFLLLLCLLAFAAAEETDTSYGPATLGTEAALEELAEGFDHAPYVPDSLEKTVFGRDDRTTISKPGQYPYSAIAYLDIKGECGCSWTGSGFMVSKDGLATAAHCLVCSEHQKWVSGITMYFGYRSNKNYTYRYNGGASYWYGSNPYAQGGYVSDDDYAYLKLEKNVGDTVGWFGIQSSHEQVEGQQYTVTGYRHGVLKSAVGAVQIHDDKHLSYLMDMEPGNSGCPVYDSDYYVIGINVCESSRSNYARRLTGDVLDQMRRQGLFD